METYGEKLVTKLLRSLPKDEYFYVKEPLIDGKDPAYQHPDFATSPLPNLRHIGWLNNPC